MKRTLMGVRGGFVGLVVCAGTVVPVALGQVAERKPLPPARAVENTYVRIERARNMPEFLDAYRRAGSPRMLVVTGATGARGASTEAQRIVETMGSRLRNLLSDPEITILNPAASGYQQDKQRDVLARNDEFAGARMLARDAGADVVLTLSVDETRGAEGGRHAGPSRCSYNAGYSLVDLRRGTTIGEWSFTMFPDDRTGEFDAYRLQEYAGALAERIGAEFADAFPAGEFGGTMRAYTVRVVGEYNDEELTGFRDALNSATGIGNGSVRMRAQEQSSGGQLTTFDLLAFGDQLALRTALRRATMDALAMEPEVLDSQGATLSVRLVPLGLSTRETALAGGPRTARNEQERARLAAAYEKAGRPSLAVMINRAASDDSALDFAGPAAGEGASASPGVNVVVGERVLLGAGGVAGGWGELAREEAHERREDRAQQADVDLRIVESRIIERLGSMGMVLKDTSAAQAGLVPGNEGAAATGAGMEKQQHMGEKALAYELAKRSAADVVVSGVARVVRTRGGALPVRIELAVRAYRVSDGVILGAASATKDVASNGATMNQALDTLSAKVTGQLVAAMGDSWGGR